MDSYLQRVNVGWSQQAVATFFGVNLVTVNKWVRVFCFNGDVGEVSSMLC